MQRSLLSGSWTTVKTVLQTLQTAVLHRNRLLSGLGLAVLSFCLVASVLWRKRKKKPWARRLYRGSWCLAIFLLLLSLTAGEGTGLGFGDGSGAGIGNGAGAGIGEEAGVGTEGGSGTQEADTGALNQLEIRIHGCEVTVGETELLDAEALQKLLTESYCDTMSVTVWDDYADNMAYLWVTETIEKLAIPYQKKLEGEEKQD